MPCEIETEPSVAAVAVSPKKSLEVRLLIVAAIAAAVPSTPFEAMSAEAAANDVPPSVLTEYLVAGEKVTVPAVYQPPSLHPCQQSQYVRQLLF